MGFFVIFTKKMKCLEYPKIEQTVYEMSANAAFCLALIGVLFMWCSLNKIFEIWELS